MHKLWFTNIGLSSGKPISFMSNFLNSFFVVSTFWQSFQRENFTIILPFFLLIRWQASILFPSIGQPTFSNIFKTFRSKSPSLTLQGTPTSSKHSRLEYWAFAQHWRSMESRECWTAFSQHWHSMENAERHSNLDIHYIQWSCTQSFFKY